MRGEQPFRQEHNPGALSIYFYAYHRINISSARSVQGAMERVQHGCVACAAAAVVVQFYAPKQPMDPEPGDISNH